MLYTINDLRKATYPKVYEVYEVFQNYFGEAYTDLQGLPSNEDLLAVSDRFDINWDTPVEPTDEMLDVIRWGFVIKPYILVWWPTVTVTNENDRSVVIKDLYAKIGLTIDGKIPYENHGFQLTRATFSMEQFLSGYIHSHIPRYSFRANRPPAFDSPCLGRGPINSTILTLKNNSDELTWMLFCEELARYVTVESLTGIPYFKMEEIGSTHLLNGYSQYDNNSRITDFCDNEGEFIQKLKGFTLWYLQHGHLTFNFDENRFQSGMSYYDFMIDISNAFIEWFNETGDKEALQKLGSYHIIRDAKVHQGKFYEFGRMGSSSLNAANFEGKKMFLFKDREVCMHIERSTEDDPFRVILLEHEIAMFILKHILRTINYNYKNEHNKQLGTGGEESPARVSKKVLYV